MLPNAIFDPFIPTSLLIQPKSNQPEVANSEVVACLETFATMDYKNYTRFSLQIRLLAINTILLMLDQYNPRIINYWDYMIEESIITKFILRKHTKFGRMAWYIDDLIYTQPSLFFQFGIELTVLNNKIKIEAKIENN